MNRIAIFLWLIPAIGLAQDKPRTDAYADALPPGAVARLGTARFRLPNEIRELALSPDGKTFVVASEDLFVVADTATGKRLFELRHERSFPGPSVTYSADSSEFFALNDKGDIDVFSVSTGKKVRTLDLPD